MLIGKKRDLVKGYGVLEKGMYYSQISEYIKLFGRKKILILIFEEMINNYKSTIETACDFLDISYYPINIDKSKKINQSNFPRAKIALEYHIPKIKKLTQRYAHLFPKGKISPKQNTIDKLYSLYEEENLKLFNLLGYELNSWQNY